MEDLSWLNTKVSEIQKRRILLLNTEDMDLVEIYYHDLFNIIEEIDLDLRDMENDECLEYVQIGDAQIVNVKKFDECR